MGTEQFTFSVQVLIALVKRRDSMPKSSVLCNKDAYLMT